MSNVTVGRENSAAIRIYHEDHGQGAPVVLVHGYLLDRHPWEKQEMALLAAGYRVITYDRRGFGASSRPSVGYNYDTLAADLSVLLDQLDLREVVLAGFRTGAGEVTRYLGTYGNGRVRAAVLLAPLPPFLPRAGDNPGGVDRGVLSAFITWIGADRPAAAKTFLDRSYNIDLLGGVRGQRSSVAEQLSCRHRGIRGGRVRLRCRMAGGLPRRPGPDHRPGPTGGGNRGRPGVGGAGRCRS
jgi:non-heme chloroperoxidase